MEDFEWVDNLLLVSIVSADQNSYWQSKGGEFESRMLHITNLSVSEGFVFS
nr:MAG TPA: hypothetical protein [Caudoviricetes sp.]